MSFVVDVFEPSPFLGVLFESSLWCPKTMDAEFVVGVLLMY
jgi:hypothetical protein